jgi:molybdopterin-guanine dinucleotide biosynthesis protein A
MSARGARRPGILRISLSVLIAGVAAAMLGVVLVTSWKDIGVDRAFVDQERLGVRYLQPLSGLVEALSAAQSAAVRGAALDAPTVQARLAEVDVVDRELGGRLQTSGRWADLRGRIIALLGSPGSGRAAYQDFGDVVTLASALQAQVTDASNLILDPALDTYYLMDVALLRLPEAMISAGRAADLLTMAGGQPPQGENAAALAVARYQVALLSTQVASGLAKTVKASVDPGLGVALTAQQDAFQAAVDAFVPPSLVQQLSAAYSPAEVVRAAGQVQSTGLALSSAVLGQLDRLLAGRQAVLVRRQQLIGAGVVGALVAALALFWLLVPSRGGRPAAADLEVELEEFPAEHAEAEAEPADILDARELLRTEALVHVGRGIRARPRDQDDDDAV